VNKILAPSGVDNHPCLRIVSLHTANGEWVHFMQTYHIPKILNTQETQLPLNAAYRIRGHCWVAPSSGLDCYNVKTEPELTWAYRRDIDAIPKAILM